MRRNGDVSGADRFNERHVTRAALPRRACSRTRVTSVLALFGAANIAEFIAVARFTVIRAVIRILTDPVNADLACARDAIIAIHHAVRT